MKTYFLKASFVSLLAVVVISFTVFPMPVKIKLFKSVTTLEETIPGDEFAVNIFPNPNNGKFDIVSSGKGEIKEVVIYNVIGEKVFSTLFDDTILKADISGLGKGLYMLQIYNKTQNKLLTKRFYIE